MRRALALVPILVVLVPFPGGCRSPTQVVVDVTTDVPCDKHGGTSVTVGHLGALDALAPTTVSSSCKPDGTVGTLVIVPAGADDEDVAFQVTTGIGADPSTCAGTSPPKSCIIARRAFRYLPHESLRVRVPMRTACAGVSCDPTSTCYAGSCVSATIDPERCSGDGCGEDTLSTAVTAPVDGGGPANDSGSSVPLPVVEAGPPADAGPPVTPPARVKVAIGSTHACALRDGLVYCWGQNDVGQVGSGDFTSPSALPKLVVSSVGPLPSMQAIAVDGDTSGALADNGALYMWGSNASSQIGYGYLPSYETALSVSLPPLRRFCLGPTHTAGVELDDTTLHLLGVWYSSSGGQEEPPYTLVDKVSALGCGEDVTTTLLANGAVYTAGDTATGNLGRTNASPPDPREAFPSGAEALWMGAYDTIVRTTGGTTFAWGANVAHHLRPGGPVLNPAPLPPSILTYSAFANGNGFHCALHDPDVWCVGANALGQLGSVGADQTSPVRVPLVGRAVAVWAGNTAACATLESGDVWCWGDNTSGMLGGGLATTSDGGPTGHPDPIQVNLP